MDWIKRLFGGTPPAASPDGGSGTALDLPSSRLNEHEATIVNCVREHGWFGTSVFADEDGPSFTYTVGFWHNAGIPEVVAFGLPGATAHGLLWTMYRAAQGGQRFPTGLPLDDLVEGFTVMLFPVSPRHSSEHMLSTHWFYQGSDFPALQLVWPDTQGRFPWHPDFEERFRSDQPDLTENGWTSLLAN